MLSPNELDWFAARLAIAVYDTNNESPEMAIWELRKAFPGLQTVSPTSDGTQVFHFEDRDLEVGPMASHDEIRTALENPFIRTENTKMSVTGYKPGAIKAALEAAKKQAQEELTAAMGTLSEAQVKAAEVPAAIKAVAGQIKKEAEDALQEFAEYTNGGPPLDDPK